MVSLLLSRGANINAFDKKDRRAIHWAAYMGRYIFQLANTVVIKKSSYVLWFDIFLGKKYFHCKH